MKVDNGRNAAGAAKSAGAAKPAVDYADIEQLKAKENVPVTARGLNASQAQVSVPNSVRPQNTVAEKFLPEHIGVNLTTNSPAVLANRLVFLEGVQTLMFETTKALPPHEKQDMLEAFQIVAGEAILTQRFNQHDETKAPVAKEEKQP